MNPGSRNFSISVLLLVAASLVVPTTVWAQGADEIGIYFDAAYTQNELSVETLPAMVPAYVVLHNPSVPAGVGGWECRLTIDGPATLAGAVLEGTAINVETPPSFMVGISDAPLPGGDTVLLATINLFVTDPEAVILSLYPLYQPSITGQMAYLNADGSGEILPLAPVTGSPMAAFINGVYDPLCTATPSYVSFPETPISFQETRSFRIDNPGIVPLELDIGFLGECSDFTVTDPAPGPVTILPADYLVVTTTFAPTVLGYQECTLQLRSVCPDITVYGTGRDAIISSSAPTQINFGDEPVGSSKPLQFSVYNNGELPFVVQPVLPGDCAGFRMYEQLAYTLQPGDNIPYTVWFEPATAGSYSCTLDMGETVPSIELIGLAHTPDLGWIVPDLLNFGILEVGDSATLPLSITNTGEEDISIVYGLEFDCEAYDLNGATSWLLTPGETHAIQVTFAPTVAGENGCMVNLGETIPAIPIVGTGQTTLFDYILTPTALDFPETPLGDSAIQIVTLQNVGNTIIQIDPALTPNDAGFTVLDAGYPLDVLPNESHQVLVIFAPQVAGAVASSLALSETITPVLVTGLGAESVISWIAPDVLDFGEVDFGETVTMALAVQNTGNTSISLDYQLETDCAGFSIVEHVYELLPSTSHTIVVTFTPTTVGALECLLDLGATVPPVRLIGTSSTAVTVLNVAPASLDFLMTVVGYTSTLEVFLENAGNTVIPIQMDLQPAPSPYSFVDQASTFDLLPGESKTLVLEFAPQVAGSHVADLSLGQDLPVIPITGTSEDELVNCVITPAELEFGSVTLGGTKILPVYVDNLGNRPLVITPISNSTLFTVWSMTYTIQPGDSMLFNVSFQPINEGPFYALITLGPDACSTVQCSGTALAAPGWNENIVGFTFDEASMNYDFFDFSTVASAGSLITGYLVLIYPSVGEPLAGWECCASIDGPGSFISWQIDGLPINVLQPPCFMVGLGAPKPAAPYFILATTQIFVESSDQDITLNLDPVFYASLPDQMAWLTGGTRGEILPMKTASRTSAAGFINTDGGGYVGVAAPVPAAEITGGEVTLTWTIGEGEFDGCRVYRREGSSPAEALNRNLLPASGRSFTFTDDPVGFQPGTVLHYSYALVAGGVEAALSPEVAVTLMGLPAVTTRLLPNAPNPFNPQTEIRFELATAGPVNVTIYNVTGRLVRTLVSQSMSAGPHSEAWFGKDDRGRQVPSGAYYIRLEADGRVDHRKVMLLK